MKLYGLNPVLERLKVRPQTIQKIYLQERHRDQAYIQKKAKRHGIPVFVVPAKKILRLARNTNSQGVVAEIGSYEYADLDEAVAWAVKKKGAIVALDRVTDPQNVGALLRVLGALGDFVMLLPVKESAGVTESVLRIACGAENYVKVAQVKNLAAVLEDLKEDGWTVYAAEAKGGVPLEGSRLSPRALFVIGSEHKGVREGVLRHCDAALHIRMAHPRMSLNVSHAAAVVIYEWRRQNKVLCGEFET